MPESAVATHFQRVVAAANEDGLDVVAAAGNTGGSMLFPASYGPVLAVGAGDAESGPGALCSFASRGEGLDVIAPGCDGQTGGLEGAFEDDGSPAVGEGSSQASAIVSAALASMRAYAPQLTYTRAEECLIAKAKSGSVDIAAAFDACGLSQVVAEGQAAFARSQQATNSRSQSNNGITISLQGCVAAGSCQSPASPSASSSEAVTLGRFESKSICPRPRIIGVTGTSRHLVLRTRERPTGCRLQARLRVRRGQGSQWVLSRSVLARKLVLPSGSFLGLQARDASGSSGRSSSQWVTVEGRKVRH